MVRVAKLYEHDFHKESTGVMGVKGSSSVKLKQNLSRKGGFFGHLRILNIIIPKAQNCVHDFTKMIVSIITL